MCAWQSESNMILIRGGVIRGCFWEERPFLVKITMFIVSVYRNCAIKKDFVGLCVLHKEGWSWSEAHYFITVFIPNDLVLTSHFCNHFLSGSVSHPLSLPLPFRPAFFFTRSVPNQKKHGSLLARLLSYGMNDCFEKRFHHYCISLVMQSETVTSLDSLFKPQYSAFHTV